MPDGVISPPAGSLEPLEEGTGVDELGELEEEGSLEELEEGLLEKLDSSLSVLSEERGSSLSLLSFEKLEEMYEKDFSEVELTTPGI